MKMVSEFGNVIKTVKTEFEVLRLKELGYAELKETKPKAKEKVEKTKE